MIRFIRLVVIFLVAVDAVGRRALVDAAYMTFGASSADMRTVEGEVGVDVMIEGRGCPGDFRVALQAVAGETGFNMDRIVGLVVIVLMAVDAVGRRALVDVAYMTFGTSDGFVYTIEREVGAVVVKVGRLPGDFAVALQTVGGET